MTMLVWLLLIGLAWGLWNLQQKLRRLDGLIAEWENTVAEVTGLDPSAEMLASDLRDVAAAQHPISVTIEVSDALALAKRYHWAGSVGSMAPEVLKKLVQERLMKRIVTSLEEGGHDADVRVMVW